MLIATTPINYYPLVFQVGKILFTYSVITLGSYAVTRIGGLGKSTLTLQADTHVNIPNAIPSVSSLPSAVIWLTPWPTTARFKLLTAFIDVFRTQDLWFMFPINLRCFTAYLKRGKHIGSNLELSLNSVVESAKPNLDSSQQSSFEMLVWKNSKAFLDASSLWEKKKEISF